MFFHRPVHRKRKHFKLIVASLGAIGLANLGFASGITYEFSGIATGTLGSQVFSNANLVITRAFRFWMNREVNR